ncbi:hypothetical protein M569_15204 [Genlisea aurea]|uniref:Vacuolar protein sorting-associated protein 62 n=1 Tax=Genlisea aurea TaxID=192259 RepID=S8C580_9LAMI|nr:hypothetical protein M569_15204 [Genlisea aurea]
MGGNCVKSGEAEIGNLPVDAVFNFPSPLPEWPPGDGFASGVMDLGGGLRVMQVWSFAKVAAVHYGGEDGLGATFFEPWPIPEGYSLLGSYAQPSNRPLFGWVLVGSDILPSGDILKQPIDYTLISTISTGSNNSEESIHFWLPKPPEGYKPAGYIVTVSPEKPSLDRIRCVRSDFTDESEIGSSIWGLKVYDSRPKNRGSGAEQLSVGSFIVITSDSNNQSWVSCLKNNNFSSSPTPNSIQLDALFRTYSPYIYFHPKETYLPASVNWYFSNGALLYTKGNESNPSGIDPDGSNLPQGGWNDGLYWIDLPASEGDKERVKRGDLQNAEAYLHSKPMLGGAFTDIQLWLFYPFNGPSIAKLGIIRELPLGRIGQHVGDWEHVTLRISNFNGILHRVFFSQHSGGKWTDSSLLEFYQGNKFVGYSSRNGHASYSKENPNLQGNGVIGLRNDTAKSDKVLSTGSSFSFVASDAPAWLNYAREWGPQKTYDLGKELKNLEKFLPKHLRSALEKLVNSLPSEVFGERGPVGPKMKANWNGDEKDDL